MKYYLTALVICLIAIFSAIGWRGRTFEQAPIEIFSDMRYQDKIKPQRSDLFFADESPSRPIPAGSQASHLANEQKGDAHTEGISFGEMAGYASTGRDGVKWGNGIPVEFEVKTPEQMAEFLTLGRERYEIFCGICHGGSGKGNGRVAQLGVPMPASFLTSRLSQELYADGQILDTIMHGKGNMLSDGARIPLRDRWAIIAYIRALQSKADQGKEKK